MPFRIAGNVREILFRIIFLEIDLFLEINYNFLSWRTAVREADTCLPLEGPIKGIPETPLTSWHYGTEKALNYAPIMLRVASLSGQ